MKKKLFVITCLLSMTALFVACGEKENNERPTPSPSDTIPPIPDYTDTPYFIASSDSVSIFTGDSVIDGQYVATCRIVDDTAYYEIFIGKEIDGAAIRRPAAVLDLRYDDSTYWTLTRAAMYEDFDHASALTAENGGVLTFDWLSCKTLKSVVDGYLPETNTVSLVIQCDMFNLYELYFGNNRSIDNVTHKTVTIALTDITFIPLGF